MLIINMYRTIWSRTRALFRRGRLERDLADEVETHLALLEEEHLRAGLSPQAARAAARRSFGGVEQMKERYRDRRSLPMIETMLQDLRYAVRMLRKSPAFTFVAVLSLALGIGANVAVFTVINAMLLRTLPVPHPEDLVLVQSRYRGGDGLLSFPMYRDLRARQQVFTDVLAAAGERLVRLTIPPPAGAGDGGAGGSRGDVSIDNVRASFVTASYFPVLGLQPALGRVFAEDDDRDPDSASAQGTVALLSEGFWARQFGRDPAVIGRTVLVNRVTCRVIGVAPRGFVGEALGGAPDLWVPLVASSSRGDLDNRRGMFTFYMARLKPGIGREQAEAQMTLLFRQLLIAEESTSNLAPGDGPAKSAQDFVLALPSGATGIDYALRRMFATPLVIVMAVVAFVLLIACANIANLLLARAASRQREITVRLALGCARRRLVRQLLTESLLLSLLGTAAGGVIAWWGSRGLLRVLDAAPITLTFDLSPDLRVLAFMMAVVVLTGVAFGLAPAWRAGDVDLAAALNDHSRPGGTSRRLTFRMSRTLVVAQVAISLVLLIGAGLLARSMRNLRGVDVGFQPAHVLMLNIAYTPPRQDTGTDPDAARVASEAMQVEVARQARERLARVPGVQAASISGLPLFNFNSDIRAPLRINDSIRPSAEPIDVRFNHISPGYFNTVGMRIISGRDLAPGDRPAAPPVAVINEAMARQFFPPGLAIGRTFQFQFPSSKDKPPTIAPRPITIVGIVADAKYNSLRSAVQPMFYLSIEQFARAPRSVEIRTTLPASAIVAPVRQALLDVSKDIMIRRVTTLDWQIDSSLAPERVIAGLCAFFGLLALLLASIGLYGVMAYGVTQRTSEIGIRMALGASRRDVLAMVLRQSIIVVIVGIAIGLPLAWAATGVLSGFLYGLTHTDPATTVLATLTLIAVAGIAAYLPARKATRVDPMIALRYE